MKGEKQL